MSVMALVFTGLVKKLTLNLNMYSASMMLDALMLLHVSSFLYNFACSEAASLLSTSSNYRTC